MAILPLVIAPDERLNMPSKDVKEITPELRQLMDDMLETMYANHGIGLAAVQVGVHQNVIVMDVGVMDGKKTPIKLINPKILAESDTVSIYEEGCLSFPGQYSDVERPAQVKVEYMDENGEVKTLAAEGITATCLQHEIDHTKGTVFVDHISKLKRDMILKRLKKAKKLGTLPNLPTEESAAAIPHDDSHAAL